MKLEDPSDHGIAPKNFSGTCRMLIRARVHGHQAAGREQAFHCALHLEEITLIAVRAINRSSGMCDLIRQFASFRMNLVTDLENPEFRRVPHIAQNVLEQPRNEAPAEMRQLRSDRVLHGY